MQRGFIVATLLALSTTVAVAGCARTPALAGDASSSTDCPPGARPGPGGCTCRADLRLVLGACTSARTAAAFCGPTAVASIEGCTPRARCERGRALDLATGECLPRRETRAIAVGIGILVAEDELVGCPDGGLLVAEGDGTGGPSRLGCLSLPATAASACPAGSIAGPSGVCTRIYAGKSVDVARWAQLAMAPEGALSPLCGVLARGPGALSPRPAAAATAVSLDFADNDVSLVTARSTAELEPGLAPLLEALRSFGGSASQASLSVRVACPEVAGRPAALSPENDHEN